MALAIGIGVLALRPVPSFAAPVDAANAVVDRWAAAFNANDAEGLVKLYTLDGNLLGTNSPILSERTEGIRTYFNSVRRPGDGLRVAFGDRRLVMVGDRGAVVTGFYEFSRPGASIPARFTMVIAQRDSDWLIVHHHSSVLPR
jgi:uncharacterized protein (TIGR02246 family)